jgi:hypothetical protein
LRDENVADEATLKDWNRTLNEVIPDIKEDDTIVSLYLPDKKKSPLFHNDQIMVWSEDKAFIKAFFDIWLGPNADESMRNKLLHKS